MRAPKLRAKGGVWVVLQTRFAGGDAVAWGPFSESYADAAMDALINLDETQSLIGLPLRSPSQLDAKVPGWDFKVRP